MNILHVVDGVDIYLGGTAVCVLSIASAQIEKGHAVTIFCYHPSDLSSLYGYLENDIENYKKIKFVFIKGAVVSKLAVMFGNNKLRLHVSSSDVVHLHGMWIPLLYHASKYARKHNIKYIITPHGMLDPWSLHQKRLKKKLSLLLSWKGILNGSHALHLLNENEEKLISDLNLTCKKSIISNGVFKKTYEKLPAPGTFYDAHPDLNGRPFVLFLSRLHYKKGIDYLLEAFRIVKCNKDDICLVIAGPDEGQLPFIRSFIKEAGLEKSIFIVGSLYGESKYAAFIDAKCFCLPSRQEGFSIAITESLACGTPVVITKNCNFPEVADANSGIVTNLDSTEVANGLISILNDDAIQKTMSLNSKKLVFENYLWSNVADKLLSVYRSEK